MSVVEEINLENLYPLDSMELLDPMQIENAKKEVENEKTESIISVIQYNGIHLILEGIYKVIAYARLGRAKIGVQVIDRKNLSFWSIDSNVSSQLKYLGKNTLYDFEAISGIKYAVFPKEYTGDK